MLENYKKNKAKLQKDFTMTGSTVFSKTMFPDPQAKSKKLSKTLNYKINQTRFRNDFIVANSTV